MSSRRRAHRRTRRRPRRWPLVAVGGLLGGLAALATALARGSDTSVPLVVGAAVAAGLLIGAVGAFLVGRRTWLIGTRRDLAALTSAPVLAVVPRHPLDAERPDDVVMLRDPNAIDAEAYRALRTTFEFVTRESSAAAGRGIVVLVTSPRPGEGKSSVAANLAAASAIAGRRVVLVDGDLRKPQIHRLFRLGNDAGVASVLTGSKPLADATQRREGVHDLVVLSAGPPPPDPAELLAGDRLAPMLQALAGACDLVVVDTPPLLAVTDPAIIVQHCDGVVMVATAGLSAKREWFEALSRLAVVDATIFGTVLLEPDDRVKAVPTYRYPPTAVPKNWWVTPSSETDANVVGLRVISNPGVERPDVAAREPDVTDDWPEHPAGR